MKKLMLSVFALAAVVFSASADKSATATGSASLIDIISIAKVDDLSFGQITLGTGIGTLTLTPTATGEIGTPSVVGTGYTLLDGITRQAAKFHVVGEASKHYAITLPETLPLSGNSEGVEITTFNTVSVASNSLDEAGLGDFYVGGSLTIPDVCEAGTYTADFSVTVAYD